MNDDTRKNADKIAKLIAKAEGTTNEHEAEAFMAKAQALMVENAINEAMLEARSGKRNEEIGKFKFDLKPCMGRSDRVSLLRNIAYTFGCRAFNVRTGEQLGARGITRFQS